MTTKTTKGTRNGDRKSGKAWGKNHGVEQKKTAPSAPAVRKPASGGFSYTMPKTNWEWLGQVMASRWPNTRRVRNIDSYFLHSGVVRRPDPADPLAVEVNPEAKTARRSSASGRKNGR